MSGYTGPLAGVTVVEFAGIGPAPFACGLLGDLGASVIRVERPGVVSEALPGASRIGVRNRLIIELDLKDADDRATAHSILRASDVVVEGYRPGVMERLGFGPADVHDASPGIVYARITGWGQQGSYANMAGHDINYIGLTGILAAIGDERPVPPLNLVGDYAGGAMYAVAGILAGLVGRANSGSGCVVDAAMVDGAAALLGPIRDLMNLGLWAPSRHSNLLDGGAPFYRTYQTSDGRYMAVGALEPSFFSALVNGLGIFEANLPDRHDPVNWPEIAATFSDIFGARTQSEWTETFDGSDACVTPVLDMAEVDAHPHNVERGALVDWADVRVPSVAPRMGAKRSRRPSADSVSEALVTFGVDPGAALLFAEEHVSYWV